MNFYEALNLHPKSTVKEIEQAYYLLARRVNSNPQDALAEDPEDRLKMLNFIRDILLNPERRSRYDVELQKIGQVAMRKKWLGLNWDWAWSHKSWMVILMAGVLLGAALGGSLWFHRRISTSVAPLPFDPAIISIPPSTFGQAPEVHPVNLSNSPSRQATTSKRPPQVIQKGSSLSEILTMMGNPDRIEEDPSQGIKILHYGNLRLILRQNSLVQGINQP